MNDDWDFDIENMDLDAIKKELRKLKYRMYEAQDELRHELRKHYLELKEELRRRKKDQRKAAHVKFSGASWDSHEWEDSFSSLGDHIGKLVTNVMENVSFTLDDTFKTFPPMPKFIFKGPRWLFGQKTAPKLPVRYRDEFFNEAPQYFAILSDPKAIKVLFNLKRPRSLAVLKIRTKIDDIEEVLQKLEEEGFVIREAVKERYLITVLGKQTIRLAIAMFYKKHKDYWIDETSEEQENNDCFGFSPKIKIKVETKEEDEDWDDEKEIDD